MPVFKSNGSFRTLGGNATVPNDAPIQPPQAFVDLFPQIVGTDPTKFCGYTSIIDLSNRGMTKCSGDYLHTGIVNGGPSNIDLSGNALTLSEVDAILAVFLLNEDPATILDLSGGTNAAPTLPVFKIDFNNLTVADGSSYGFCSINGAPLVYFRSNAALAATMATFDGSDAFANVGISDSPTKQQIITKLVAIGGGKITQIPINYVTVGGAGTSAANGNYFRALASGGGAYAGVYYLNGNPAAAYAITHNDGGHVWAIRNNAATLTYYYSNQDVASPDLVTAWQIGPNGSASAPTVVAASNNLGIQVAPANYDLEELLFSGLVGSGFIQGNNSIGTLRANGWTVTTN